MRINKFVALASNLSRRQADAAIAEGRVLVNGVIPEVGQAIAEDDVVTLDGLAITPAVKTTLMLNKPVGSVVSRDGQGSPTIYDLLPPAYQHLNPVGRLDKNSSGLLLMTNDGDLAQELTHPSRQKQKIYKITLDKPLIDEDKSKIKKGVQLEDGPSQLTVIPSTAEAPRANQQGPETSERDLSTTARDDTFGPYEIRMHEGRNRQIRRTFAALGYEVKTLHRTHFGPYSLGDLANGEYRQVY